MHHKFARNKANALRYSFLESKETAIIITIKVIRRNRRVTFELLWQYDSDDDECLMINGERGTINEERETWNVERPSEIFG